MKVRTYGALMGALLTIASVESAEAADCKCVPEAPKHRAADNGRAYAQSGYDYRSASRVTESFVRRAQVAAPAMVRPAPAIPYAAPPMAYDDGFRIAPNDARIRYFRDEKVVYGPVAYAPAYGPPAYGPPAGAYYPPPDEYGPPAYDPQDGFETGYDPQYDTGGVGYNPFAGAGGGGGFGGAPMTAYLYDGSAGGSDAPPNGGGVNLPPGYGPYYNGGWQGPPVPTSGGLGKK